MATFQWKPSLLAGSWTAGDNWTNTDTGLAGDTPGPDDTAAIDAASGSVTVTLGALGYVQAFALGGSAPYTASVVIDGGGLHVLGGTTGTGTVTLTDGSRFYLGGTLAPGVAMNLLGGEDLLVLTGATGTDPGVFAGAISGFGGQDEIGLNLPYDARDSLAYSSGTLSVFGPTGADVLNITINLPATGFALAPFTEYPGGGGKSYVGILACFARRTRILTDKGEVPVEALAEGDLVVACDTGERMLRPIRWIGHRRVNLRTHPEPLTAAPIRIKRGAFADGLPSRDLLLSPDHAVFVDGKLIPARLLLNGRSIVQDTDCREITYFHLELDRHAVLLAEGLPAESYLDTGNRGCFANAAGMTSLQPDFAISAPEAYLARGACAPLAVDRAEVEPVWGRLCERAGDAQPATEPITIQVPPRTDPALVLMAGSRRIRPADAANGRYVFPLPRGVTEVQLVSRRASPAATRPYLDDRRMLGVKVGRLAGDGRTIPLDGASLGSGWLAPEGDGRWTDGNATLALPSDCVLLEVDIVAVLEAYPEAALAA